MNRIERSEQKIKDLFGAGEQPEHLPEDPEFQEIRNRFVFGDVFYEGELEDKTRELILLVVLTANQTLPQLATHVWAALNVGLTPAEIKEALYQCAPYLGFPKTQNALNEVNAVFQEANVNFPPEPRGTVDEDTRLQKGLAVQKELFGEAIDTMRANAPVGQTHIQDDLSAFCFGDFYTRNGLDLKTRELLTFCIISTLGGCENQVKAHVNGNLRVGNNEKTLIAAITQCLPYIGFPRTLNAIACINAVISE